MKAFAVYEKLEDIPEELRTEAVKQDDGTFKLPVEGLTGKVSELLGKNKQYKEVYDKFSGLGSNVTQAQIQQALKDMTEADAREQQVQERIRQAIAENNKTHEATIQAANKERDNMKTSLEERIIDNELNAAITTASGLPEFISPQLRGSVVTVFENGKYVAKVVGPDKKPRLSSKTGEAMTIAELVEEAKSDKKFAPVFKAPVASGAGSQAGAAAGAGQGAGAVQDGVVKLTSAQAKDARTYREAMGKVGGDATKIQITDAVQAS